MKKNIILYIIIVILACALTGSVVYVLMSNRDQDKTKEEENKEQNNNQEEESEEQVTLSERELEEYLKYIPQDNMNENQNMYINPKSINELTPETLLGATLNYADKYTDLRITTELGDEFLFSKDKINELMQKLYNKEVPQLEAEIEFGCVFYSEQDDNHYIQSGGCGSEGIHLSKIDSYQATEEELIIYEYGAYVEEIEGSDYVAIIKDYISGESSYIGMPCPDTENDYSCYLEESLNDYTLYKHTFKKNDTGYYWYSTEVA